MLLLGKWMLSLGQVIKSENSCYNIHGWASCCRLDRQQVFYLAHSLPYFAVSGSLLALQPASRVMRTILLFASLCAQLRTTLTSWNKTLSKSFTLSWGTFAYLEGFWDLCLRTMLFLQWLFPSALPFFSAAVLP